MTNDGFFRVGHDDGDGIEPAGEVLQFMSVNEIMGDRFDVALLVEIDDLFTGYKLLVASGFDFDKDDRRAITHDEVDFAPFILIVAGDVAIPEFFKELSGQLFTLVA